LQKSNFQIPDHPDAIPSTISNETSEIPAERPPFKTASTDYDDVLAHDLLHLIVEIEPWIGEAMKVPSDVHIRLEEDESAFICTVRYLGVGVPVRGKALSAFKARSRP
jgi:hypothetical protein